MGTYKLYEKIIGHYDINDGHVLVDIKELK